MALQQTSLTAAITSSQLTFGVTSSAAFPPVGTTFVNQPVLIDAEFMVCVGVPQLNVITVRSRGNEGTAAVAHDVLANVYTSAVPNDFPAIPAGISVTIDPSDDLVVSIGQDSTITSPTSNTVYNINKITAALLVLSAPSLAENGVSAVLTSQTAAAHVITATGLLMDGTAAAPKTTATYTAGKGATMTLIAENGFWNVVALQGVTLS